MSGGAQGRAVPALHVVTDDEVLAGRGFAAAASAVLARGGGALALHLRGPATTGAALFRLASALAREAHEVGAILVVNDRVDVALAAGADGAHLGERSLPLGEARRILGPRASLGRSVHTAAAAAKAAEEGADWVFAGHVLDTPSHPGRLGAGMDWLGTLCRSAPRVPVLAIGGLTPGRVADACRVGAWGVAVIRGVWGAPDPARAVGDYLEALSMVGGAKEEGR